MECPYCGGDSRVLDSRGEETIRRRRQCHSCGRRFTTYERPEPPEIRVVKRSGESEPFDRQKISRVVDRLLRDRPPTDRARRDLVRGLEAELVDSGVGTVDSGVLALRLLARLEALDAVAARRFASNYIDEQGNLRMSHDAALLQLDLPLAKKDGEE